MDLQLRGKTALVSGARMIPVGGGLHCYQF